MHKLTETDRTMGWSEEDDLSHYYTLLRICNECGFWTQFEDDPDRTSITSGPKGETLRCMNCGSIMLHNPTSWRSFDFDKKGSKVLVWDPSNCPPSKFDSITR